MISASLLFLCQTFYQFRHFPSYQWYFSFRFLLLLTSKQLLIHFFRGPYITSSIHKKLEQAGAGTFKNHAPLSITGPWRHPYRSFTVTQQKNKLATVQWKKSKKCYKRLIYKQYVQVSGLCGPQFLRYLPKRFTHLCTVLVHQYMAAGTQQKHLEFTFSLKALSFLSRTSIRTHKHSTGMETSIKT